MIAGCYVAWDMQILALPQLVIAPLTMQTAQHARASSRKSKRSRRSKGERASARAPHSLLSNLAAAAPPRHQSQANAVAIASKQAD